jgi:hypothetical protein
VTTLSDAFLRLQLRAVREGQTARVMLLPGDDRDELRRRIHDLAYEQGLDVRLEFDKVSFSLTEAPPARAAFG